MRRSSALSTTLTTTSISYQDCLAKTYIDEKGVIQPGRSVFSHCQIVGEVAKALLDRMPPALQESLFPSGSALLAACHDIGKVSPTFFIKLMKVIDPRQWRQRFPELVRFENINESLGWGGHAGVSALAIGCVVNDRFSANIVGQHHGYSPNIDILTATAEVLGGDSWQQQRIALISELTTVLNETWPVIENEAQARAIAGLTSVADWIGSGHKFEYPNEDWHSAIPKALDEAGFIKPLVRPNLNFGEVFGNQYSPRDAQSALIDHCAGPGVYVLEAPMGMGKTEAALFAAYKIISRGAATGIYFALPTQLTSNKIYERFNLFLQNILSDDNRHKTALLLHSHAWLMASEMGEEGQPGRSWFNTRKRGLLAPFAVGTLDQALMAAMNVKHGFVRAFGLAGKIVILDEVHSYDAYTSVILDELIALLRQLHCTVIILSATLTQIRRQQLLGQSVSNEHYPLVSCSSGQHPEFIEEINVIAPPASKVELKLVPMDDKGALSEALARAQTGQLVLWIENTVTEAQNRFFDFAGRCQDLGVDCGLLHSRFTQQHRQKNENIWVSRYGKVGNANRGAHGGILIGTQVLEQSLDIDADFLISRIAPTDMLLQRIGRLWRHQSTTRPVDAHCDAWILAPDIELAIANPLEAFGPTAWVYSTYVLCRSLEVWRQVNECGHIELPRSIRNLIERTYSERQESGSMGQWKDELYEGNRSRKGLKVLQQLARMTLSRQGKTLPESKAQTRYSEGDNTDLLLLKKFVLDTNMKATQLTLLDNRIISLPWQAHRLTEAQWKQIAVILMQQIVTCREEQAPTAPLRVWCQKIGLGHALYLGDPAQDDSVISIAVVTETGELISLTNNSLSDKWRYQYRDDLGLQIIKVKE